MNIAAESSTSFRGKTVQEYIDEVPSWPDGSPSRSTPMSSMQWAIWALAAAGKFFEGFVVFMGGVSLPLIAAQFHIGATEKGLITSATLAGILVGSFLLGGMSDHFGRKRMFIAEMIIFLAFLVLLICCTSYTMLVVCLFGLGMALGCDYPTAHMILSENLPSQSRGRMVLGAFAFQAIGAMCGIGIGAIVLIMHPALNAWRWMYATALAPAIVITVARFFIPESANWLISRGALSAAENSLSRLLNNRQLTVGQINLIASQTRTQQAHKVSFSSLFKKPYRRATVLAAVPWFLQDLGTYGIGVFTPTILVTAFGHGHEVHSLQDMIANSIRSAEGSALTTSLLIVGILVAIALVEFIGRIKLQVFGFIGCAIGLAVASLSMFTSGASQLVLIFSGFMLFNFMTNLGPNSQTYLLAGEVFPTRVRGMGAGFAAMFAKIGAVATTFGFPLLLAGVGTTAVLWGLVVASLVGAIVTWKYRIETTGVDLDSIGREEKTAHA